MSLSRFYHFFFSEEIFELPKKNNLIKILVTGSNGFLEKSFVSAYKDKCELLTSSFKNSDINIDLVKEDFQTTSILNALSFIVLKKAKGIKID
jgi:hypothetical protein